MGKRRTVRMVIFTDLDGTLLDPKTYSFDGAKEALLLLKEREVPLVLCSSKTRAEIEYYRTRLENNDPFISENGGAIFIPLGRPSLGNVASLRNAPAVAEVEIQDHYVVVRLGASYGDLRKALASLRARGFKMKGFGDMTVGEIARLTGLSAHEAALAKEREFDEPFTFEGEADEIQALFRSIQALGLHVTKGRFFHLLGKSDKGKAVSILSGLYAKAFGKVCTVALGDSPNDIPMLEAVDLPAIVEKEAGGYDPEIDVPNLVRAPGIGPKGWNGFVRTLLKG